MSFRKFVYKHTGVLLHPHAHGMEFGKTGSRFMHYSARATLDLMKFNLDSAQEDARRLGIILVAAGVLNAFFEGGDTLTGITVILVISQKLG